MPAVQPKGEELWHYLQEILLAPHAAEALRTMHSLGLLTALLPEFAVIDSLVIRDYSHRFTVDEHSFVAIENLHALRKAQSKWDRGFAELLDELEQPDLLYLTLLLHDTGKGTSSENHVAGSLEVAKKCLARLDLDAADRDTVLFLIERHLDLGAALRRDIFDPETIHQIAERMVTPERLKMLCLLTYADIKAVNPEALTPWKMENIWQLYIGAANFLMRSVDERLRGDTDDELMNHLRTLAPAAGEKARSFSERLASALPADTGGKRCDPAHGNGQKAGRRCRAAGIDAGTSLVRANGGNARPAVSLCADVWRSGGVGNEHREGRRVLE